MRPLSRRFLLRGVCSGAAVGVALPSLEAMWNSHGSAFADGTAFPKRFGAWFWGNGVQNDRWLVSPQAGEVVPTVREGWWNYLAPQSQLTVLNQPGVRELVSIVAGTTCHSTPGTVHHEGRAGMMTGSYDPSVGDAGLPTLPSVDQVLAAERGHLTPYASLELGVSDTGPNEAGVRTRGETSTKGGGVFLPMEKDPLAFYARLFGASPVPLPLRIARLSSVVSAVSADACRLRARLGKADQQRLQQHMDGLSDLENRLSQTMSCPAPAAPTGSFDRTLDASGVLREQLALKNEAIVMMLAYALKCDLTRTFCFEYTTFQASTVFPQMITDYHTITHSDNPPSETPRLIENQPARDLVSSVLTFTWSAFLELLTALSAVEDAPGVSLLQSSAIVTATDVNQGYWHGLNNMPTLVAGGAGGALHTGNVFTYPDQECGKTMLTLMRAVGSSVQTFGTGAQLVTEPFAEMLT